MVIPDRKRRSSKVPDVSRLLLLLAYAAAAPQGASQLLDGSIMREACLLPLLVGPCRSAISRYHFNATSSSCSTFLYGGCNGNTNNFATEQECLSTCQPPSSGSSSLRTDAAPVLALQFRGVPTVDADTTSAAVTVPQLAAPATVVTPGPQFVAGNATATVARNVTAGGYGNMTAGDTGNVTVGAPGNMTAGLHGNMTLQTAEPVQIVIDVEHIGTEIPHVIAFDPAAQLPTSVSTTSPLPAASTPVAVIQPATASVVSVDTPVTVVSVGPGPVPANSTAAGKATLPSAPKSSAVPKTVQVWTLIVAGLALLMFVW